MRLTHASGNMFASTAKRQAMYRSQTGDVITHGEAAKDHAYIRSLPTAEAIYDELAIRWNPATMRAIGPQKAHRVMVGGKHGTGARGDRRRRGPNRYVLAQPLEEIATGQQWLVVTHHAIAKADTSQKWRRGLRASAFREVGRFVDEMRRRYPKALVVLDGDWNTIGKATPASGLTEIRTPGTFGRLRYDRIQVGPRVKASDLKAFRTPLDHRGLHVTLTKSGTDDPPAPPPEVPPVTAISQNGYRANDRSLIETRLIPGTNRSVALRKGAPGDLLRHFAAWFDKAIESIDGGTFDDWGYAERTIRGSATTLSNHASGTALDLNATKHPLGKRGTFTPGQASRIRAELKRYEGAIRWGGDYRNRADEMHLEIMASPERCAQVLAKLTAPAAPAAPAVVKNHVTAGRALIRQGIAELRKAPTSRVVVHQRADDLEAIYRKVPPK